jgi:hypothetical protein
LLCYMALQVGPGARHLIRIAKLDLDNAYYRIRVAQRSQWLLAFERLGKIFVHCGLPFGWKNAPAIFLRVISQIWRFLLYLGILCSWYMDDAFFIAATADILVTNLAAAKRVLLWAGHKVNEVKSSQGAETVLVYLGFVFDVIAWTVRVKPSTLAKLRRNLGLLSAVGKRWRGPAVARLLEKVVGQLNFVQAVVRGVAPYKAFLIRQQALAEKHAFWSLDDSTLAVVSAVLELVACDSACVEIRCAKLDLASVHGHCTSTDACLTGYGGWGRSVDGTVYYFFGEWADLIGFSPVDFASLAAEGRGTADLTADEVIIADLELATVMMGVDFLLPRCLAGSDVKHVQVWCDNTNACSWVNRLYAASQGLPMQQRRLQWLIGFWGRQVAANRHVLASYIATEANHIADGLSRKGPKRDATIAALLLANPGAVRVVIPQTWRPELLPSAL